jgi:hypothetical protein
MTLHCPCGAPAKHLCADCHRALCEWHCAGGPRLVGGALALVPVRLPDCAAAWWRNPTRIPEARRAEP